MKSLRRNGLRARRLTGQIESLANPRAVLGAPCVLADRERPECEVVALREPATGPTQPHDLRVADLRRHGGNDLPRNFVLDVEDVGERSIEPLRPYLPAAPRFNQ